MRTPDPLEGYVEPWVSGRCTKPACECEDDGKLCWVCEAEWAAMKSDAEIHDEPDDSETDPWLEEVRDPTVDDDELFDRAAALEQYPDD